jgi:hypothetical protein
MLKPSCDGRRRADLRFPRFPRRIFNLAFSSCIGPLSWAYPVEVRVVSPIGPFSTSANLRSQILPTHLRAQGTAITSCFAWISNFLIAQVYVRAWGTDAERFAEADDRLDRTPIAFRQRGWQYYIAFCVMSFSELDKLSLLGALLTRFFFTANAVTIWALFPETKGRRLEVRLAEVSAKTSADPLTFDCCRKWRISSSTRAGLFLRTPLARSTPRRSKTRCAKADFNPAMLPSTVWVTPLTLPLPRRRRRSLSMLESKVQANVECGSCFRPSWSSGRAEGIAGGAFRQSTRARLQPQ